VAGGGNNIRPRFYKYERSLSLLSKVFLQNYETGVKQRRFLKEYQNLNFAKLKKMPSQLFDISPTVHTDLAGVLLAVVVAGAQEGLADNLFVAGPGKQDMIINITHNYMQFTILHAFMHNVQGDAGHPG
jgi:hypothetical protein